MEETSIYKKNNGALWEKISLKNGNSYLSGVFNFENGEKLTFVAFRNKKQTPIQPDYLIYINKQSVLPLTDTTQKITAPTPKPAMEDDIKIEEIPF